MNARLMVAVDALDQALRRARGGNHYRGRAHYQPAQRRWILEAEPRGTDSAAAGGVAVNWSEQGFAYRLHGHEYNAGLTDDLDAFLAPLLAALRGDKPHVHTHLHRTEYKPGFETP